MAAVISVADLFPQDTIVVTAGDVLEINGHEFQVTAGTVTFIYLGEK